MLQIFLLIPTCEERNRILSVTVERYHVPVLRNILDHRMQNIKLHHGYSAHSVEMRTHPYITADCVMPFIESKFMCCCPGQDVAEPCLWDNFGQEPVAQHCKPPGRGFRPLSSYESFPTLACFQRAVGGPPVASQQQNFRKMHLNSYRKPPVSRPASRYWRSSLYLLVPPCTGAHAFSIRILILFTNITNRGAMDSHLHAVLPVSTS
jgi:hypothetical protein